MTNYPFIYIASLMRTGSTVLSEALTRIPYSFIFREPHIGKNTFQAKESDLALFRENGFDLEALLRPRLRLAFVLRRFRSLGFPQDYMVHELRFGLMKQMKGIVMQFGVKEIDNRGWRNYHLHFPNMKVIISGRDPRDIYLSVYYRWKKGMYKKRESIIPEEIAAELNAQFLLQCEIERRTTALRICYEDLCFQPESINKIKAFVQSPIPTGVKVGHFNEKHPFRQDEAILHAGQITNKQVGRWRREENAELVGQAHRVFDLMPEYTEYWGYKR